MTYYSYWSFFLAFHHFDFSLYLPLIDGPRTKDRAQQYSLTGPKNRVFVVMTLWIASALSC